MFLPQQNLKNLRKNSLCKCTITGNKQLQKRNVTTLNCAHHVNKKRKKKCKALTEIGRNDTRAGSIAPFKSSKLKRFVWCLNKVERKYIQEQ